jgi:hypothetical protein
MRDIGAFHICSPQESEAMSDIAYDAQCMVRDAADASGGAKIKAQMNSAARNLGYAPGDWRIKAAWYGEAGAWGAAMFRDLENRYAAWKNRRNHREELARGNANKAASELLAVRDRLLAAGDEDFHREQLVAIDAALAAMGFGDCAMDGADTSQTNRAR